MNSNFSVDASIDYQHTLAYFFTLHEVRFKLLGFLPLLAGAAVVFVPNHVTPLQQLALGCFGILTTLGLASYDQRNTQIYDRLVRRARLLEREFHFIPLPGDKFGGSFHCRPCLQKTFGIWLVWHIQGLTIVYSTALAAWVFLCISAATSSHLLIVLSTALALIFSYVLIRLLSKAHYKGTLEIKKLMGENGDQAAGENVLSTQAADKREN